MSLLFLVDGYNAMQSSDLFTNREFRDARTAFLGYLEAHRPQGSTRNRLIVVFDGRADVFGERCDFSFEVVFTKGESADEKIKELVAASPAPKSIVVVSDDKGITSVVRRSGASIMSTSEFLRRKKLGETPRSMRRACDEPKADLNIVEREAITQELKGLWLKKRSS